MRQVERGETGSGESFGRGDDDEENDEEDDAKED